MKQHSFLIEREQKAYNANIAAAGSYDDAVEDELRLRVRNANGSKTILFKIIISA